MLLQQVNPHLSIKHMPEVSLGGLTVITGVNGAGKSHLLQAIETQNIRVTREDGMPLNLRRYDWTNMVPSNANQASGTMTSGLYQTILGQIEQQRNALNQNLINVLSAYQIDLEANVNLWKFCEMSDKDLKTAYGEGEEYDGFRDSVRGLSQQLTANVVANVGQNIPQRKCIDHIIKERKTLASVNQKYINTLPFFWEHGDLFQHSFAELFLAYFNKQISNYALHGMEKFGEVEENNFALSNVDFVERHGQAPWDFVNESMGIAGLDFEIDQPTDSENRTYRPTLTKKTTGDVIEFGALSSGEKILMSFAFCLYHASDSRTVTQRPNMLLFDEIDAPLHPSMCRRLMSIINETLVKKNGIDVIFVTHSPSTIAVSPEDSVYLLEPVTNRLTKETKRRAIAALTAEIPTMSINFDSRRQVFVESDLDARRYEKLYLQFAPKIETERSLVFIGVGQRNSSGDDGGGCAQVKKIVNSLTKAGNESVYGLIDWDGKNSANERVRVLSSDLRYSIENCLLDPILIAALLMQKDRPVAEKVIGNDWQYMSLSSLTGDQLQALSTKVQCLLLDRADLDNVDTVLCTYVGSQQIEVAKSLLEMRGHDLEELVKNTFHPLKSFKNSGELLNQVVETIIPDHSDISPMCILESFKDISEAE
jgi:ABC-type molybdenum transport system ATPase subunit/photorepair protein PhrA